MGMYDRDWYRENTKVKKEWRKIRERKNASELRIRRIKNRKNPIKPLAIAGACIAITAITFSHKEKTGTEHIKHAEQIEIPQSTIHNRDSPKPPTSDANKINKNKNEAEKVEFEKDYKQPNECKKTGRTLEDVEKCIDHRIKAYEAYQKTLLDKN